MKEIKEKVRDQSPKIRNPASRLPKELVRSAMLEAKEKSSIMADKIGRETAVSYTHLTLPTNSRV